MKSLSMPLPLPLPVPHSTFYNRRAMHLGCANIEGKPKIIHNFQFAAFETHTRHVWMRMRMWMGLYLAPRCLCNMQLHLCNNSRPECRSRLKMALATAGCSHKQLAVLIGSAIQLALHSNCSCWQNAFFMSMPQPASQAIGPKEVRIRWRVRTIVDYWPEYDQKRTSL